MGTPKTLIEAIRNALHVISVHREHGGDIDSGLYLESVVRDYLAQKFTPDLMDDAKVVKLWERIVDKDKVA